MARRPFGAERRRFIGLGAVALGALALAACNSNTRLTSKVDPRYGVSASPRVVEPGEPVPKGGGTYRVGKPYVVAGRTYYPEENRRYRREGIASWYGEDFHGRLTANGEVYDMEGISAAHPTMPMPSYARVTNLHNGRSLIVRVNDRGPYHADRVIDLSGKAAELLELRRAGTGRVRVEYVGPAALEGSDDRRLLATLREGSPAPAPSAVMIASSRPFVPELPPANPPQRKIAAFPAEQPADDGRIRPWTTDARAIGLRTTSSPVMASELPPPRPMGSATLAAPASAVFPPIRDMAPAYAAPRHDSGAAVATGRGLY
jgi:peptidoglycan lytic transglycosylase